MGLLASGSIGFETFRSINTYTPLRDTPYVTWWETVSQTAVGSKVTPPAVPVAAKPAASAEQPAKAKVPAEVKGQSK